MRLLLALLLLSLASCAAVDPPKPEPPTLQNPALTEISGIAVSRRNPSFLWLINDSGSPPTIHLAGTDGTPHGSISLTGVQNIDWEDLAAFPFQGKPHLLIADTGDNKSVRPAVSLHLIEEPPLPKPGKPLSLALKPKFTITFRYQDGPRDCEAVAVDPQSKTILLLSNRTKPPVLYQLPLRQTAAGEILTAKRLGPIAPLPKPPGAFPHPFGAQPTAMDLSSDARLAAVLSYQGAYLYPRDSAETWAQAFTKAPQFLGFHGLSQAESLAFSPDSKTLSTTSEGLNPPIFQYSLAKPSD